ncbi:hypothetical protein BDY21DRAFT_278788 [Lineolata rhizophorae]|uniref:Methyltransferase type 11 domain-containing protein n=1 Tax=Lineolata rhizophorae TaxID=578093 RepID=A0A6A6PD30_9PEZI|nr:hypothetical protein BDY21DRAFT_278788 [Lineolata rhizophorae]
MSSYKSNRNPARGSMSPQRNPASRLPTRSATPTAPASSGIPVPSASASSSSRLAKKRHSKESENTRPARKPSAAAGGPSRSVAPKPAGSSRVTPALRQQPQVPPSRPSQRLDVPSNVRTPSLVSGSSASTVESPQSVNVRKRPSPAVRQGSASSRPRGGSASSQEDGRAAAKPPPPSSAFNDPFPSSVLGITLPPPHSTSSAGRRDVGEYVPGIDPPQLLTEDLPPPTPLYAAASASPSTNTRYSESPGPFSHASTPTSMSSHSPGIVVTSKSNPRARPSSPTRVNRVAPSSRGDASTLEPQPLASIRESSTSSSSASTVKAGDGSAKQKERSVAKPPLSTLLGSSEQVSESLDKATQAAPEGHRRPASPRPQHPPELAHLLESPPRQAANARPPRPSREGTSDILSLREPSPVIQSNLTSLGSTYHRRQSSTESKTSSTAQGPRSKLPTQSKAPSRNPSPNLGTVSNLPRAASRTRTAREQAASPREQHGDGEMPKKAVTAPQPSPSPNKFSSRFGFFRRAKTEPSPSASAPKPERKLKKGPMAGTGHEGYGKYAARGRSGSTTSGTGSVGARSVSADSDTAAPVKRRPSSRKSSIGSSKGGESDVDDFFLERLNPVVIRGEGSSTVSVNSSSENGEEEGGARRRPPSLLPSAMTGAVRSPSPSKQTPGQQRRPSDSGDEGHRFNVRTIAARRSFRRSQLAADDKSLRLPKPIKTTVLGSESESIRSSDHEAESAPLSKVGSNKGSKDIKGKSTVKPKDEAQPKLSRKWNFFQRTHAPPKKEKAVAEVPVALNRQAPPRSVAHYALGDAVAPVDMEDLERLMQEADETDDQGLSDRKERRRSNTVSEETSTAHASRDDFKRSILLPDLPSLPWTGRSQEVGISESPRQMSPQPYGRKHIPEMSPSPQLTQSPWPSQDQFGKALEVQEPAHHPPPPSIPPSTTAPAAPRPSRLPQVGRIPQVVSRRDRDRQPPAASFSRPFGPSQPSPAASSQVGTSYFSPNEQRCSVTGAPGGADRRLSGDAGSVQPAFEETYFSRLRSRDRPPSPVASAISPPEFFAFPRRNNSELSYSSSSGILTFPTALAAVPPLHAGNDLPSEDEVWREYDDLIDDVLNGPQPKTPASATSSHGAPFQYNHLATKKGEERAPEKEANLEPPHLTLSMIRSHTKSLSDSSNCRASSNPRGSRMPSTMHPLGTPNTTLSIAEFFSGYGERNAGSIVDPVTGRLSLPSTSRISAGSGRTSLPTSLRLGSNTNQLEQLKSPNRNSAPSMSKSRDSRLVELADTEADGLVSMANLRFGALMVSKWLSFGRVLFSPAHFEMKNVAEDRVLILDGLGKDWSYYCALTYPEASVYNLGPDASMSSTPGVGDSGAWQSLPNHRHIHHPHIGAPFPFPRGFFAAVIFRFPSAASEVALRHAVFECKRVLRPGGYLELSVLDLDMQNMGNRARRAVRNLKVKMQVADSNVSLKPISDNIQRLLGRRGFENLKCCLVGVPAAGRIPSSQDMGLGANAESGEDRNVNFSDLLKRTSGNTDEGITKMVARVGRWWYSRCYESGVLPYNDLSQSIWADDALVRECEKRGTSFRLLICHAQKPMVARRRTVSV